MKNMSLIINTHWDREYRWSINETQYRLVEAVDDLLDIMQRDPGFAYFHTDSQVSMMDDYIEMRPERADEVKKLVSEGRILTGPWYTLPAEYLVNGEALARNIIMGHELSANLGKTMKAGYNIFSWGQVSQLPQIYRQFGMDTIIFYRGINQTEMDTLEFRWKGADDTEALGLTFGSYHRLNFWKYVYLPYILGREKTVNRDDLGNAYLTHMCGESLFESNQWLNGQEPVRDLDAALDGLQTLIDTVIHKSSTDELLFLQGFDQENPDPIITELLEKLNAAIDDGVIKVACLEDYIAKVRSKISPELYNSLPELSGEMLSVEHTGDPFGPLYNGVFSARMPIKLRNADAEYQLVNSAEPVAAWGRLIGKEYPSLMFHKAWKELLKNQQHDGIGGCHVDRVTRAMIERYEQVCDTAQTITKKTLKEVTGAIDYSQLDKDEIGLVIYNTLPIERSGVIKCAVDVPKAWNLRYTGYNGKGRREICVDAFDLNGNKIPAQLLCMEDDTIYTYLKFGDVFAFDAARCTLVLDLKDIPENGYIALKLKPKQGEQRPTEFISPEFGVMENEYLNVEVNHDGSLKVTDKKSGVVMDKVHYFEDTSEKAGPLTHNPTYEQLKFTTLNEQASVALVYNGPLQATYQITWRWKLPKRVVTQLKIHVPHGSEWVDQGKLRRSDEMEELVITSLVTLKKGAKQLHFHTTVNNNILDHRLRAMFRTGRKDAMVCRADSPFDVVKREITVPDSSCWYEEAARTWPSHSFVSVSDGVEEATVVHKGIHEYEVTDDKSRTIALTLLRCFSNAGNPTEVHEYQEAAECQGIQVFDYWFMAQPGEATDFALAKDAIDMIQPCHAMQTTAHKGYMGAKHSFISLGENDSFMVTAVTAGKDANSLLIRGVQLADTAAEHTLKLGVSVAEASKVTLEGKHMESLEVVDGTVKFQAAKREIVNLLVKWDA